MSALSPDDGTASHVWPLLHAGAAEAARNAHLLLDNGKTVCGSTHGRLIPLGEFYATLAEEQQQLLRAVEEHLEEHECSSAQAEAERLKSLSLHRDTYFGNCPECNFLKAVLN